MLSPDSSSLPRSVWKIFLRVPDDTRAALLATLPIHEGGAYSDDLLLQTRRMIESFGPHLAVLVSAAPTLDTLRDVPPGVRRRFDPAPTAALEGTVRLTVIIARDGTVLDVAPMAGPASLLDPAMDAVRRWKYQPALLNGIPVEVQTIVEIGFTLTTEN